MLDHIKGLHHVTSLAADAQTNNNFFTRTLGLRRVKKTVNFDTPDVYHLYYGDELGTPGSVMTYFPFPNLQKGSPGAGEVGTTVFAIPRDALDFWRARLQEIPLTRPSVSELFGEKRLSFQGPDGDHFALVEADDFGVPWTAGDIGRDTAIRGFHSVSLRLRDEGATAELLRFMGYEAVERTENVIRFELPGQTAARRIDLETLPHAPLSDQGAGSVHHIAFAVEDQARQLEVRNALLATGHQVTPVIDRSYFWSIYFRTPGGVLFEVATNEPGFTWDEDSGHLGQALKLPSQHVHLLAQLEQQLQPIED